MPCLGRPCLGAASQPACLPARLLSGSSTQHQGLGGPHSYGAGRLEPGNPADCLFMEAGLVAADRLYTLKKQLAEDVGFGGC